LARRLSWIAAIVVLGCVPARAERLPIRTYTTAEGLAHNRINRIVRDARGFLWFCTADGLSRFDGSSFVTFRAADGLPGASVTDLLETSGGELLVATNGGLAEFHPKRRPMFVRVPIAAPADRAMLSVNVLREAGGTIWAGTGDGLYRLDATGQHRSLRRVDIGIPDATAEGMDVSDVLDDGEGGLWVTAPSGLFRRWKNGRAARYTGVDGISFSFIEQLFRDRRGRLWAGTRLNGFMRLHPDAGSGPPAIDLRVTDGPDQTRSLPISWVSQIFEASDGQMWLATPRGLVAVISGLDSVPRFRVYGPRNGLGDASVTALGEDLAGNLWLGTQDSGVLRVARDGFHWFGRADGLETVNTMFDDAAGDVCFRGNVVDASPSDAARFHIALGCFDADRFDSFVPPGLGKLVWGWVQERTILRARSGDWWIGTGKGLFRFAAAPHAAALRSTSASAIYAVKEGLAGWQVFRLFEDSLGRIWISVFDPGLNALDRLDPATGRITDLTNAAGLPSFRDDRPRSFAEDGRGQIWLGFTAGLARYAGGRFTFFGAAEGLPPGAVRNMHVDRRGRLWLASSGSGLIRVDALDAPRPTFTAVMARDGLSSNLMEVVAEDNDGRIYAAGGMAVNQLDPVSGRIRQYTIGDGPGGAIMDAFRDRQGTLWFGTTRGIARLTLARTRPVMAAPVFLTAVRSQGVAQAVSPLGERDVNLGELHSGEHLIEVDFTGLTFDADAPRYEYRLDGAGGSWNPLGAQRTVTLASLPAGNYRLRIRAAQADDAAAASLSFVILPPLWRRWWAIALEGSVVVALALSLHRFRLARAVELADVRTRIALDLHDDVGANLTRIALLSEVARRTNGEAMESIARIARESAGSMSDIVWAINPERDSVLDLVRRMREHADDLFRHRGVELAFSAVHAGAARRMRSEARRDVLLIFKEAVNNVARHARCRHVRIDIRQEASRLRLVVADDGVHFDSSADGAGHGIASMQRRAVRLGGALEISPTPGGGTTVTLECPV
jgi:signal transduction histidine kinase/ligand-binding sensor domain-containing protein